MLTHKRVRSAAESAVTRMVRAGVWSSSTAHHVLLINRPGQITHKGSHLVSAHENARHDTDLFPQVGRQRSDTRVEQVRPCSRSPVSAVVPPVAR